MADNVGYTPGAGAEIAADEIAGVLYQRVKIGLGEDGSAVDLSATNPMPVDITNAGLNVTVQNASLAVDVQNASPIDVNIQNASPIDVSLVVGAPLPVEVGNLQEVVTPIVNLLNSPRGYDHTLNRQKGTVILESGTVTTVTTVTTLSNITSIGGIPAQLLATGQNLAAWAVCCRSRIS